MIEDELKAYIKEKFIRVSRFAREIGVPNSTITTVLYNGIHTANKSTLKTICEGLNIDQEELVKGKIVSLDFPGLKEFETLLTELTDEDKLKTLDYMKYLKSKYE